MKIKVRTLKIGIILLIIAVACLILYKSMSKPVYSFSGDSFSYSENRGKVVVEKKLVYSNDSYDLYKVSFLSRPFATYEAKLYGFLLIPKEKKNLPGIVLLPGGGVPKENELPLASILAEAGYAVLTIDQRGIGESRTPYLGIEQDYQVFTQGNEPVQHLSVYDVLRSFDVLSMQKEVNKKNIFLVGESMGGRYAIIAAAMEPRVKGLVTISSAGFHIKKDSNPENSFLISIDPDRYIAQISPRPIFMFHGSNDSMVSLGDARVTYDEAKEPKEFFVAQGCGHGYCEAMKEDLFIVLNKIIK